MRENVSSSEIKVLLNHIKQRKHVTFHRVSNGVTIVGHINPAFNTPIVRSTIVVRALLSCLGICQGGHQQWIEGIALVTYVTFIKAIL